MSVKNKKQLVWWNNYFNSLIKDWIIINRLDLLDSFNDAILFEKEILRDSGFNPYDYPLTGAIDRTGKNTFLYNSVIPSKWIPYQEQNKQSFEDCMFETAQSIANDGRTIDLFWSGGLDSTAILIAFNELGLEKQLRLIIGGELEETKTFNRIVKNRIEYVVTPYLINDLWSVAKPNEHVWVVGAEADPMFGAQGSLWTGGVTVENEEHSWNLKRRYLFVSNAYRYVSNCRLDSIDISSRKSFYGHPSIERFTINHALSGDMVYYNLTHEGWGDNFHNTRGYNSYAPSQKFYLKCKMPIREFIYKYTNDEEISYKMLKVVSEERLRMPSKKPRPPLRNIAITSEGDVITRDNFLDRDWSEYINININS